MVGFYVRLWYRTSRRDIDFVAKFQSYEDFLKEAQTSFSDSIEKVYDYLCKFNDTIEFSDTIEADLIEYEESEVSEFVDLSK